MKRILAVYGLLSLLFVTGCAGMPGTNTGALVGGVAGAAFSRDNPIAGALIGAAGGALLGNIIDHSDRPGDAYRGNRGRSYYERLERQRAFEEQMEWRRQQQRHWERQRFDSRHCSRC